MMMMRAAVLQGTDQQSLSQQPRRWDAASAHRYPSRQQQTTLSLIHWLRFTLHSDAANLY